MSKKQENTKAIERVEQALDDIREGKIVILVDDADRENEGDLCMAAEKATPEAINFMAKYGRGLICLTMTPDRIRRLRLPMMVDDGANECTYGTAFTVSIEAKEGVTTGISAADRAKTILTAVADEAKADEISGLWPIVGKEIAVNPKTQVDELFFGNPPLLVRIPQESRRRNDRVGPLNGGKKEIQTISPST